MRQLNLAIDNLNPLQDPDPDQKREKQSVQSTITPEGRTPAKSFIHANEQDATIPLDEVVVKEKLSPFAKQNQEWNLFYNKPENFNDLVNQRGGHMLPEANVNFISAIVRNNIPGNEEEIKKGDIENISEDLYKQIEEDIVNTFTPFKRLQKGIFQQAQDDYNKDYEKEFKIKKDEWYKSEAGQRLTDLEKTYGPRLERLARGDENRNAIVQEYENIGKNYENVLTPQSDEINKQLNEKYNLNEYYKNHEVYAKEVANITNLIGESLHGYNKALNRKERDIGDGLNDYLNMGFLIVKSNTAKRKYLDANETYKDANLLGQELVGKNPNDVIRINKIGGVDGNESFQFTTVNPDETSRRRVIPYADVTVKDAEKYYLKVQKEKFKEVLSQVSEIKSQDREIGFYNEVEINDFQDFITKSPQAAAQQIPQIAAGVASFGTSIIIQESGANYYEQMEDYIKENPLLIQEEIANMGVPDSPAVRFLAASRLGAGNEAIANVVGLINGGIELIGYGMIGGVLAKSGIKYSAKFISNIYGKTIEKIIAGGGAITATSFISGSQEYLQAATSAQGRAFASSTDKNLFQYTSQEQMFKEFKMGAAALLPISFTTMSAKQMHKSMQDMIQKNSSLSVQKLSNQLIQNITDKFNNAEITEEDYTSSVNKVNEIRTINRRIPSTIKGDDRDILMGLIEEKNALLQEREITEDGLTQEVDLEIQSIEDKIKEIGEKNAVKKVDKKEVSEKNIKIAEENKELMAIIKDPNAEEKDINAAKNKLTKLNEGLRFDIINRRYDPSKDTGLSRSQVESEVNKIFSEAIRTFTPEKGEFGAYARGIINVRFPDVFGQVETQIDTSGKKAVVSKEDITGMEFEGESVSQPDLDTKENLIKKRLFTKKIDFDTTELEGEFKTDKDGNQVPKTFADVFTSAVTKTFGTKLPSVINKKDFVKEFSKSNIAQLMPFVRDITKIDRKNKVDKFKPFIIKHFKPILDQLPESVINKKYDMLRKPILKESGKQKREETKEGKGEFEYLNIDRKDFVDYFTNKNPDVIATAAGNITFKNDKGVESKLRVTTKNGKPLISKRLGDQITIDGKNGELTKIEIGSATLSDRRTSLLNTVINELSADAALEVIKDESIMDKFKQIQELEGKTVPKDFLDKIVDALDRGIKYLDDMQNNSTLRVGFVLPELAIALLKNILKFLKVGIKAGQDFNKALLDNAVNEAAKEPDSTLRNEGEIKAVETVISNNFKSEKDLTDSKINKATKEAGDAVFTERLVNGLQNTLFPYIGKRLSRIKNPELMEIEARNLIGTLTRGITWSANYLKTDKNPKIKKLGKLSNNKVILTELKNVLPKRYFGPKAINLSASTKPQFYYGKTLLQDIPFTEAKNVVERGIKAFNEQEERSFKAKKQGMEFLINLRADVVEGVIDINIAEDIIEVAKMNTKGILRRLALPNILFDFKEGVKYMAEHNRPLQDLVTNYIMPYLKGEIDLEVLRKAVDDQRLNYVSEEFNAAIPKQFKEKGDPNRYNVPLEKFKGQFVEYNPIKIKEAKLKERIEVLTKNLVKGDLENLTEGQAIALGKKANRLKIILPYGAEDLLGLLYPVLRKGKLGDSDLLFFKEELLDPLAKAFNKYDAAKLEGMVKLRAVKQELADIGLNLQEVAFDNISQDNAIRIHLWANRGYKIPDGPTDVLTEKQIKKANQWVRQNIEALNIKDIIEGAYEGRMYPEPSNYWRGETLTTDLLKSYNVTIRKEYFADFFARAQAMFGEIKNNQITGEVANNLTVKLGTNWADAFNNMLTRIATGRHRNMPTDKYSNAFTNWINSAVSAIMFVNTRSVLLQTISNLNFINGTDNNIFSVAAAYGNPKQFITDFHAILTSDFLVSRRSGLKIDVNLDELSNAAEGNDANRAEALLAAILKKGFIFTSFADSFAIAFGGAPFYRNRTKTYEKQGLSLQEAESKAFEEMRELAEESQQSSRQDKISMQQASGVGKLILAFQNYPMQATRIQKRAVQDLIARRGSDIKNVRRILYYGALQNALFHFLQSAAFYVFINQDELNDEEEEKRLYNILNRMADTILAGSGFAGVVLAATKNVALELADEFSEGGNKDTREALIRSTGFSPPINSKLRKIDNAFKRFERKQEREKMLELSFENPFLHSGTELVEAATNLPANRVLRKIGNVKLALDKETDFWRSLFLYMGYNKYDLFMYDFQLEGEDKTFKRKKKVKKKKVKKRK